MKKNLNTKKTVKSIVYYISKLYYYCYSIYMHMYYLVTVFSYVFVIKLQLKIMRVIKNIIQIRINT